jgi:hypothetical protein
MQPHVAFTYSFRLQADKHTYNISQVSKAEKQVKQWLYQHLLDSQMPVEYLFKIDAPVQISGLLYLEIYCWMPLIDITDITANKPLCETIIDKAMNELEKTIPTL